MSAAPLEALWTGEGTLSATRGRLLDREAIRELLRRGPVRFVVADVGQPLRWVPEDECLRFWKTDLAVHLAETDEMYLDDFADGVAYVASEWLGAGGGSPIVLVEVHH